VETPPFLYIFITSIKREKTMTDREENIYLKEEVRQLREVLKQKNEEYIKLLQKTMEKLNKIREVSK